MRTGCRFLAVSVLAFAVSPDLLAETAAELLQRVAEAYNRLTAYHFEMDDEGGLTTDWS